MMYRSVILLSALLKIRGVKLIPWRAESLLFFFFFQLRLRQPGEASSLLISDLNSAIKYKREGKPGDTLPSMGRV